MLCALVFVGFGHIWVQGAGSVLVKSCYYDCGVPGGENGQWYDQLYFVSPITQCPARFVEI